MSNQKGSKKVGRNKRKPANMAYLREMRWERNAKLRKQRHERKMQRQHERVMERTRKGKFRKSDSLERKLYLHSIANNN